MCGFAGFSFQDKKLLKKMGKKLSSRNKDGESFFYDEYLSLYHAGLKLRDLGKNTNQPFIYKDLIISFVGEIYNKEYLLNLINLEGENNYTELEIIGLLYNKLGTKFIDYINGEFIIFIFDKNINKYFLFRDRYGTHTVYFTIKNNNLYFSSEIKGLIFDKIINLNKKAITEYLTFQFTISPNTLINNIYVLKPGHFIEYNNGNYNIKQFGIYIYQDKNNNFLKILEESVKRRITKGMKKVFIPLSGGSDSNIILFFLKKHFKGEIISYTFYNKNNLEDLKIAKYNSKKFGIKNYSIDLDKILKNYDYYSNMYIHEGLVKLINIGEILRNEIPEYKNINIEFSGDGREELFLVNDHYNYKNIVSKYKYFYKKGSIDKYEITQEFLNLNMFDFNLQLIEKLTLNNLIERRLPFTDYELLKFRGEKNNKNTMNKFLLSKGFKIVKGIYGHNDGIGFQYIENKELVIFLKHYKQGLIKDT